MDRSASSAQSLVTRVTPENLEAVIANSTGIQLAVLAAQYPLLPGFRPVTCLSLRTNYGVWLFNCGEDSQRHLHRVPYMRHKKIERIFITHRDPDTISGLPGMLCTISAARERGHQNADVPLHVYGPPGIAEYIRTMLLVSDTYLEMPVLCHELLPRAVEPANMTPRCIARRSRLWLVQLPPDQLNPSGYYDGTMQAMLARAAKRQKKDRFDLRAQTRELPLPGPGDPTRTDVPVASMTWTIRCEEDMLVTALPLPAATPSWGYVVQEADRAGRLDVEKCVALDVPPGRKYSQLKAGVAVENRAGVTVQPEQVLSPDRPGRRLVVLGGPQRLSAAAARMCQGAEAVAVEASASGRGLSFEEASRFAAAVGVGQLLVVPADVADVKALQSAMEGGGGDSGGVAVSVVQDGDLLILERKE